MCNLTLLQLSVDLKSHSAPDIKPGHCEGSLEINSFLNQITPSEWSLFPLDSFSALSPTIQPWMPILPLLLMDKYIRHCKTHRNSTWPISSEAGPEEEICLYLTPFFFFYKKRLFNSCFDKTLPIFCGHFIPIFSWRNYLSWFRNVNQKNLKQGTFQIPLNSKMWFLD